jgi:hypothetical protein
VLISLSLSLTDSHTHTRTHRYLLKEAKQRIPPVLMQLEDPDEDKRADMAKTGTALSSVMSILDMNKKAVYRAQRGEGGGGADW